MLSSVPFDRYSPRVYIVSEGDVFSERKAEAFEKQKESTDKVRLLFSGTGLSADATKRHTARPIRYW